MEQLQTHVCMTVRLVCVCVFVKCRGILALVPACVCLCSHKHIPPSHFSVKDHLLHAYPTHFNICVCVCLCKNIPSCAVSVPVLLWEWMSAPTFGCPELLREEDVSAYYLSLTPDLFCSNAAVSVLWLGWSFYIPPNATQNQC